MEDVKVKQFLCVDGSGFGNGLGSGDGNGYGYGDGYGLGDGSGYGYGEGYGLGDGSGYGGGEGYGLGDGSGYGGGDGGLDEFKGQKVYLVDGVPTIFTTIHGNVAKGYILQSDLTMTPCFVVKNGDVFAHGDTLHEAMTALTDKLFDDMSEEDRIAEFIKAHPEKNKPYPNRDLFDWHHRLTGSCMAGRTAFVKDRGLTLDGETTVTEFIKLTENAYNGSVFKKLDRAYSA